MNVRTFLILLSLAFIAACNKEPAEQSSSQTAAESVVLAKVNNQTITQDDVDFMIQRTFSNAEKALLSQQTRDSVLQSLIASTAMSQVMQSELSKEQIELIENKTKAYQEELYVKEYLIKNASPKPVSTKMVQSYYERHPEEFGGGQSTTIELLKSASKPSEQQRDAILQAVTELKNNTDWAGFAKSKNDLGLQHFRSVVQPGLFEPVIEQSIKPLEIGESSGVIFVKQVPHIIKVIDKQQNSAKPLASVSASIRKKLAAIELKKAIKKASDDVVQKVEVQIQ